MYPATCFSENNNLQRSQFGAAGLTGRKEPPQGQKSTDLNLEALNIKLTELEAICSNNWTKESSERTADIAEVRSALKKLGNEINESKLIRGVHETEFNLALK